MKKYIDVDLLKNEICKNKIMSREFIAQRILHIIDNQPTADVEEVVRCKDCKYWHGGDCYRIELTKSNDFCSYGEKADVE